MDTKPHRPIDSLDPKARALVEQFQWQVLKRGCGALAQLSCVFRRIDDDFSKKLSYEELEAGAHDFGLSFSKDEISRLFTALDRDKNGHVDFNEFMELLIPPMADSRKSVINEAFDKLDINGDEEIKLDELKVAYSATARRYPKYLSGEWTEEETLRHFLDSLDTPGNPDGKVTRQEFLNYYAGVSATVDDDCYFDMMMRSVYSLPQRKLT